MFSLSLLLTTTLILNFVSFNIPTFTNQAFVQSSTVNLAQTKNDELLIPREEYKQRYNVSPAPLLVPLPTVKPQVTPTPILIPTPQPTKVITPKPSPPPLATIQTIVPVDGNLNPQSLFNTINNYRIKKGLPTLAWDQTLANYAQGRASSYQQAGSMDHHAGFRQLTSNSNGFHQLGFRKLGENSSSGFSGNPIELVESLYANSPQHQENQINSGWSHMGTGVSGGFTNIVFGGGRI